MKSQGSVLIMVLGLLAILAVVGVTFITMSSFDQSVAASFARESQIRLAADGAVDYVCHHLVEDVWEYNTIEKSYSGLLTDKNDCEPFDCPGTDDRWLTEAVTDGSVSSAARLSFGDSSFGRKAYGGIPFGAAASASVRPDLWPDNLRFSGAGKDDYHNGVWNAQLAMPFDLYLVRVSVTVLDHGAMLNVNAHGNTPSASAWTERDLAGFGYFVSDVDPSVMGGPGLGALLLGSGGVSGCWGDDGLPGNEKLGAVVVENPRWAADLPYTLAEEFELRRLKGTLFLSRLEQVWSGVDCDGADPPVPGRAKNKMLYTTVGWTAEVRGDGNAEQHRIQNGWSLHKVDLNTASATDLYNALKESHAYADGHELAQLVTNIIGFREQSPLFKRVSVGGYTCVAPGRQPIFSQATATLESTDGEAEETIRTYKVKVEIFNPWDGDHAADSGLALTNIRMKFRADFPHSADPSEITLAGQIPEKECLTYESTITCKSDKTLKEALDSIEMYRPLGGKDIPLDLIDTTDIGLLETHGGIQRTYQCEDEERGTLAGWKTIRVFYVNDWKGGGNPANMGEPNFGTVDPRIPIRFPKCVPSGAALPLPLRVPKTDMRTPFMAFARVGDLNQVLAIQKTEPPPKKWWSQPWVVKIAKAGSLSEEASIKFNWKDTPSSGPTTSRTKAANVLCVGGPWKDDIDNDGDGKTDSPVTLGASSDTGEPGKGRFGGPEFRVAGKINLNTATETAIAGLVQGVGVSGAKAAILATTRPMRSIADILSKIPSKTGPDAAGWLEERDLAFTRISNIATVRSDTFSIYGTVQVINPERMRNATDLPSRQDAVVRTRRFWALVDRSPSLAYPPHHANFIPPRILNFQWLE